MTRDPDLRRLERHEFHRSGQMPQLLRVWEEMKRLAGPCLTVGFPQWSRGPLDIAVQLRGYDNFIADTRERPQFVHDLMRYIVEERIRWWEERTRFLGAKPDASGISDDWVNVPFISPAVFEEFCLPRYLELEQYHGRTTWLHSCGDKSPLVHLMLRLKTLTSYEVNHWTPLEPMLAKVPADKHLSYAFQNLDVLLGSEAEQEAKIRRVVTACQGRSYSLCGQALQRLSDDYAKDIRQIQQFIRAARRVLGRGDG
jgi:uroporphyrinogen-III decarboxylase